MDKTAAADRKNTFKNKDAFGSDQVRNRRQKHTVEIRKQKREENLSKRRNMNIPSASMSDSEDDIEVEDDINVGVSIPILSKSVVLTVHLHCSSMPTWSL